MQSSGPGTNTVTSEYTEDIEEEKKEPAKPQHKQVDRQTWKEAKPHLQQLVDNFGQNKYESHSFTIKSV